MDWHYSALLKIRFLQEFPGYRPVDRLASWVKVPARQLDAKRPTSERGQTFPVSLELAPR